MTARHLPEKVPLEGLLVQLSGANFNACYSFITQWMRSRINQEGRKNKATIYIHSHRKTYNCELLHSPFFIKSPHLVFGSFSPQRAESWASSGH